MFKHLPFVVLAASAVACAHAQEGPLAGKSRPEPVFVTGSHIPVRLDATGRPPISSSPVRIYSRQALDNTGRSFDLRAALDQLDPSFH